MNYSNTQHETYRIGRLQLAGSFVYVTKQAKITFVIHGDIG